MKEKKVARTSYIRIIVTEYSDGSSRTESIDLEDCSQYALAQAMEFIADRLFDYQQARSVISKFIRFITR